MYNDDYRDFEPLEEFENFDEFDELDAFRDDEEEFVDFTPPYGCPYYRQQFPGGQVPPPRPPRPQMPPQGAFPGGVPGGFPGGAPGGFPGGAPGGFPGITPGGFPSAPPPNFVPPMAQAQQLGAPGGEGPAAFFANPLRRCLHRYVYIWLRNGVSFWAWLTFAGRNTIAGYRWNGRRWVYFTLDVRRIRAFRCF